MGGLVLTWLGLCAAAPPPFVVEQTPRVVEHVQEAEAPKLDGKFAVFAQPVSTLGFGALTALFGGNYSALVLSGGVRLPLGPVAVVLDGTWGKGRDVGDSCPPLQGEDPTCYHAERPFEFFSVSAGPLIPLRPSRTHVFLSPKLIYAHGWQGTYVSIATLRDGSHQWKIDESQPAAESSQYSLGLDFVVELNLSHVYVSFAVGVAVGMASNVQGASTTTQRLTDGHAGPTWLAWGNVARPGGGWNWVLDFNFNCLRLGVSF